MKKKIQGKKKKGNKKRMFGSRFYLVLSLVLVAFLLIFLFFSQGMSSSFAGERSRLIELEDECVVIKGNLMQGIKNEPYCYNKCRNRCEQYDMSCTEVDFVSYRDDCNSCKCHCER